MKLLDFEIEEYKRSSPAKMKKRFAGCVIDMILVTFISVLVFSGIFKIVENTNTYKEEVKIVNNEINYYKRFTEETHLTEYLDGQAFSDEVIAYKNVNKAIYLSYLTFGNGEYKDYIIDDKHEVAINGYSTLENDNIAYFYTQYIPNYDKDGNIINMNGQDPLSYLYDTYRAAFGNEFAFMFTLDKEKSEMPILNSHVAYSIFYYIYIDDADSTGKKGANYYQIYATAYANMLDNAKQSLIKSEPYYSEHYRKYEIAYSNQARYTNICLLLSIFISYLIGVLLPKYLLKGERTIGYRLLGLGVITTEGETNKWYIVLCKSIIGCIGYVLLTVILYMFAPFNGAYGGFFEPFTINSKISLAIVVLIVFIIGLIVNIFGLFTHYHQNLINLIFDDKVVDIHYLDEGDNDDKIEGRSY